MGLIKFHTSSILTLDRPVNDCPQLHLLPPLQYTHLTRLTPQLLRLSCLGQLVASPFFGVWSNYRPVREPLVVSTIINVAANIVYAYGNAFQSGKKWALLVSRAFVGFGAGERLHWVLLELVTMQYFGMLGEMVCIPGENVGCSHKYVCSKLHCSYQCMLRSTQASVLYILHAPHAMDCVFIVCGWKEVGPSVLLRPQTCLFLLALTLTHLRPCGRS